jgi:hypothetical protein
MLKNVLRSLLRSVDAELLRYYPAEKELIDGNPCMTLRDALRVQALATEGQIN